MVDNYLQFSEHLINLTTEEGAWLKSQLQTIVVFGDQEFADDDPAIPHTPQDPDFKGPRFLRDNRCFDHRFDDVGFTFSFLDDRDAGCCLWLHADTHGDPNHVAWLVRKFLKRFRADQCWWLTYAKSCSKPQVGGFSGGAFFVTATEVEELHAYYWAHTRWAAFQQSHKPELTRTLA